MSGINGGHPTNLERQLLTERNRLYEEAGRLRREVERLRDKLRQRNMELSGDEEYVAKVERLTARVQELEAALAQAERGWNQDSAARHRLLKEVRKLHADFHWVVNSLLTDSQLDVVHPSTGEYLRFYFGRPPEGELAAPSQELLEEQAALAAEGKDEHE